MGDDLPSIQIRMSTEAKDWNFKIQFPTNSNFINRIKDVEFGLSKSSGNPMFTVTCEVISPATVDVAGELVNIAGVETKSYYTTIVPGDEEKSAKCKDRLVSDNQDTPGFLYVILGQSNPELIEKFDPENPSQELIDALKGKCILTSMQGKAGPLHATPTSEEIAAAKEKRQRPQGKPMLNPRTGKPIVGYRPQITEVFALAPEGAGTNQPY